MDTTKMKVAIIGCARDIAGHIQQSINKLIEIKQLFHPESVIIIGENDSRDGTKQILSKNVAENGIALLNLDGKLKNMHERTQRIAFVRKELLKYVHKKHGNFDYLIIADMDGVIYGLDITNISKIFSEITQPWDALFANVPGPYYDIWALRAPELGIDFDCWDAYTHLVQNGMNPFTVKNECIYKYQTIISVDGPLIPVKSAFGGFGIYKLSMTRSCNYEWKTHKCSCKHIKVKRGPCRADMCEHVSFHLDMIKKGAKLYICPFLLVSNQTEHIQT
jgi:hypothetical protein